MEINSLRSYYNYGFRNNTRTSRSSGIEIDTRDAISAASHATEQNASNLDFSSMTPRDLRDVARASLEEGAIDQETFSVLSEGLPMEAVDLSGRLIDLSHVTDDTPFDFRGYFESQLNLALSIGDNRLSDALRPAASFVGAA